MTNFTHWKLMTTDERATYQSLRSRGFSHEIALGDALDGVGVDDVREAAKTLCWKSVGSKPWWMSEDQFSPCKCLLGQNHDGECKCEHTIGDDND